MAADPLAHGFRLPVDPVEALVAVTAMGFYSRIGYRKGATDEVTFRVVEPRQLLEGVFGVRVRAMQLEPEPGARTFSVPRIVSVAPDQRELSDEIRKTNRFGKHYMVSFGTRPVEEPAERIEAKPGAGPPPMPSKPVVMHDRAVGPAWSQPWFAEYVGVVRESLMDLRIEQSELAAVEATRQSLGMTDSQIRAAHAYILAEDLLGLAADGDVTDEEEDYVTHLAMCLGKLGWSPG